MNLRPCTIGGDLHDYEKITKTDVVVKKKSQDKFAKDILVCKKCGNILDPWNQLVEKTL